MKSCIPQEKGNCCEQVQVWGCQRDLHKGRFSFSIYRDKSLPNILLNLCKHNILSHKLYLLLLFITLQTIHSIFKPISN